MLTVNTAQKMKFSVKDFFSKCDQIRSFLPIWSHLLKKSLIKNFIFCVVHGLFVLKMEISKMKYMTTFSDFEYQICVVVTDRVERIREINRGLHNFCGLPLVVDYTSNLLKTTGLFAEKKN